MSDELKNEIDFLVNEGRYTTKPVRDYTDKILYAVREEVEKQYELECGEKKEIFCYEPIKCTAKRVIGGVLKLLGKEE